MQGRYRTFSWGWLGGKKRVDILNEEVADGCIAWRRAVY